MKPLPVRLLDRAGDVLRGLGVEPVSLDGEALLEAARRKTGLEDFGEPSFREGFDTLLACYEKEARLSTFGRMRARNECVRLLANRLQISREVRDHPEIGREAIRTPIFVIGFPRTGTTLLHNLLAQDPAHRVLLTWEAISPVPPPERATRDDDPRRLLAERGLRRLRALAPEFATIHPMRAAGPEECVPLQQHAFASMEFETAYNVPTYARWLEGRDLGAAYRYYRELLKLLQWKCAAERWVLKSPAHLFALDALLETFPDAHIVQTHRDPLRVLPSQASLVRALRRIGSDHVDAAEIGRELPAKWARGMERAMAVRDRVDPGRFFDVQYAELVAEPLGTVARIYDRFGLVLDSRVRSAMAAWLAANPQGKHGRHRYSVEEFAIDREVERRRFAEYRSRFRVPAEG